MGTGRARMHVKGYPEKSFPGEFELIPRFSFYERSKAAFGVIATGETSLYANLILTKGIVG